MLLDCPEEVLVKVFKLVDRQTYTSCLRVRPYLSFVDGS
jgi:hypothetical protein